MPTGGADPNALYALIGVVGAALVTAVGAVLTAVVSRRKERDAPLEDSDPTVALLALQDAIRQRDAALADCAELRERLEEAQALIRTLRAGR